MKFLVRKLKSLHHQSLEKSRKNSFHQDDFDETDVKSFKFLIKLSPQPSSKISQKFHSLQSTWSFFSSHSPWLHADRCFLFTISAHEKFNKLPNSFSNRNELFSRHSFIHETDVSASRQFSFLFFCFLTDGEAPNRSHVVSFSSFSTAFSAARLLVASMKLSSRFARDCLLKLASSIFVYHDLSRLT